MSSFNNDIKRQSQLDPGGVLKSAHSDVSRALRVTDAQSLIDNGYTHYSATFSDSDLPTSITYKQGTEKEKTRITFVDDVASSLNDTYFTINAGRDSEEYYVWYNVDGAGTDPAISGKTGIEVEIQANDADSVVGFATKFKIDSDASLDFTVQKASNEGNIYEIEATRAGIVTDAADTGSTGFTIEVINQGAEENIKTIAITYDSDLNPIYDGQTLRDYRFNIITGKFEQKQTHIEAKDERSTTDNYKVTGTSKTLSDGTEKRMLDVAMGDKIAGVDYDYVSRSLNVAEETWTFKQGGSSGTTVQTIIITYTDATLAVIDNVEWS